MYALTPKGEVVDLQQGATVLDFAYQVHHGRHRCRGAKVDGRIVQLNHPVGAAASASRSSPARPRNRAATGCRPAAASSPANVREKVRARFNKLTARATCRPGANC